MTVGREGSPGKLDDAALVAREEENARQKLALAGALIADDVTALFRNPVDAIVSSGYGNAWDTMKMLA